MLLGFVPKIKVKVKVEVMHISTANIWEMLVDKANITIAIEYDVPYARFRYAYCNLTLVDYHVRWWK